MGNVLYKYRSVENFKNFVDIILKNRLYAAQYKSLNDPMEGQYYYHDGELDKNIRDKIYGEKQRLRLCSLSQTKNNELMWSHYSNGHKGVAIGVVIDDSDATIRQIEYNDNLSLVRNQDYNGQTAIDILSHKLGVWNYEKEVRVFVEGKQYINVKVKEIITGRAMKDEDFEFIEEFIKKVNSKIKIIKADTFM